MICFLEWPSVAAVEHSWKGVPSRCSLTGA